jgi:hypothetical protein
VVNSFNKQIGGSTFKLNIRKIKILKRLKHKTIEVNQNYGKSFAEVIESSILFRNFT